MTLFRSLAWAIFFGLCALMYSYAASAQDEAPFGLIWDMSKTDIEGLGVHLTKMESTDFGESFAATSLPKTLSDVRNIFLSFGHNDKLWRVAAISREFERDGYGASVRSRYDELKGILAARYGSPKLFERLSSDDFYSKADNFVYGIYSNENVWGSLFVTSKFRLELSIGASGPSDAYWRITYVNIQGETSFQEQHSDAEADVL